MLPCDRDFGNIDKHIRSHVQAMYTRDQWAEGIIKSIRSKPFKVTKMITRYCTNILIRDELDNRQVYTFVCLK